MVKLKSQVKFLKKELKFAIVQGCQGLANSIINFPCAQSEACE